MNILSIFILLTTLPKYAMTMAVPDPRFAYQEAVHAARFLQTTRLSKKDMEFNAKKIQALSGLDRIGMIVPSCLMKSRLAEEDLRVSIAGLMTGGSVTRPDLLEALNSDDNSVWMVASGHILDGYFNATNQPNGSMEQTLRFFFHDTKLYGQSCMDNHLQMFGTQVLFWENGGDALVRDYIINSRVMTRNATCEMDALLADIKTCIASTKVVAKSTISLVNAILNSPGVQEDATHWIQNTWALSKALDQVYETLQVIRSSVQKLGIDPPCPVMWSTPCCVMRPRIAYCPPAPPAPSCMERITRTLSLCADQFFNR